ncbi:MAG: cyclic pyranopterin monophosphate synthase MoaC [Nitrospirae bacterium]|nr:cyclic pyranopterin monophosphate synthase MoaC [Nitrospirota bacterium]
MPEFTHFDSFGNARMVDVTGKEPTEREATATGKVSMKVETLALIKSGGISKGDVLGTARIAAILGSKQTPYLIPMCHPLGITSVVVDFSFDDALDGSGGDSVSNFDSGSGCDSIIAVNISATVKVKANTGVEMEALTAVSIAALTIYDMCKAVDREMVIGDIKLIRKSGGKSGLFVRPE